MSKTIFIGGRLESKEKGNVVAGANAILDDTKGKKQNVINKETDDELLRLEQSKQDNLTFDNAPTEDSTNPVTSGGVYTAEKALSDAIEAILLLIPSAATALNKLVDTNTMNSSISTATATFRGTYNAVSDLGLTYQATHAQIEAALDALGLTADNNDYAFVQVPVSDQSQDIAKTERYKNNGTNWQYEYDLNTSGFTAAQWGAINSTITLTLVQKLAALPTNAELLQALGLKQDVLTFDNAPTTDSNNPVKSDGIKSAIDTAVGDETTARENADAALGGLIGDEQTRAEGVEGGLNTRLEAVEGSVSTIQGVIPSGAAGNNKLVDNNSMTTYIGTIIDNIDATFNMTSTDGHVTLAITQVNGVITSVQLATSDIASAAALNLKASQADLTALAGRVTTAEGNITSLTGRMTTAESDIDTLTALYNALQQSAPQVIQPTDTWPVANPSTTVIYRVIDRVNTPPEYYSDYMWNGTSMVLMATYNNAVDTTPKKDSANLITSGGVFANIGAFDISEYHKSESTLATYADLTAALAALPSDYQKGGMSIKFVQSSDNKYVQFRLMNQNWSTTVADWQGVDDVPTSGSNNMVKSGGVYPVKIEADSQIDAASQNNVVFSNINADEKIFVPLYNNVITNDSVLLVKVRTTADVVIEKLAISTSKSTTLGNVQFIIRAGEDVFNANEDYYFKVDSTVSPNFICIETRTSVSSEDNITVDVYNLSGGLTQALDSQQKMEEDNFRGREIQSFQVPYSTSNQTVTATSNPVNHELLIKFVSNTNAVFSLAVSTGSSSSSVVQDFGKIVLSPNSPKYIRIRPTTAWVRYFIGVFIEGNDTTVVSFNVTDLDDVVNIPAIQEMLIDGSDMGQNIPIISGYSIHLGGTIQERAGYSYCPKILVKRGDILFGTGVDSIGDLSKYVFMTDEDGTFYTPIGIMWYGTTAFYIVENDGYIAFNVRTAHAYVLHWYRMPVYKNGLDIGLYNTQRYTYPEVVPYLENLSGNVKVGANDGEKPVTLLHFSDIHGSVRNIFSIKGFVEKYKSYLSDVLCSGDMVAGSFTDYNTALWNSDTIKDFLLTIGNHDVYDYDGDATSHGVSYDDPAYRATNKEVYDQYFATNIARWGVTQPNGAFENGYCYYYKDYDTTTFAEVAVEVSHLRLIVIDPTIVKDGAHSFDTTQLQWFTSVLEDARTNGYPVVVAMHYSPILDQSIVGEPFNTPFNSYLDGMVSSGFMPGALAAVDDFIENGGEFVCWLGGHFHYDKVGKIPAHNNQIYIAVASANAGAVWLDHYRNIAYDNNDLFNVISIDVRNKILSIRRFGMMYDKYLRKRECMIIDYANKMLLSTY